MICSLLQASGSFPAFVLGFLSSPVPGPSRPPAPHGPAALQDGATATQSRRWPLSSAAEEWDYCLKQSPWKHRGLLIRCSAKTFHQICQRCWERPAQSGRCARLA